MQRENQRAAAGMSTTLDPRDAGQGQHQALLPPAGQGDTVRDVQCLCYPQKGCEHNSEQRRTSKCYQPVLLRSTGPPPVTQPQPLGDAVHHHCMSHSYAAALARKSKSIWEKEDRKGPSVLQMSYGAAHSDPAALVRWQGQLLVQGWSWAARMQLRLDAAPAE